MQVLRQLLLKQIIIKPLLLARTTLSPIKMRKDTVSILQKPSSRSFQLVREEDLYVGQKHQDNCKD